MTANNGIPPTAAATDDGADGKFIIKYRHNYYDITKFLKKHPGGVNTLKGLNNIDVTSRFMKAPPHSDAAMYLMKEYIIKDAKGGRTNGKVSNIIEQKLNENGVELLEEEDSNNNNNHNNKLDESMELLVDWNKAMLPQIPKITEYYDEWVHKPVDRPLRLFGPWYLEIFTKTPWWAIPTFWIPIIIKCLETDVSKSWRTQNTSQLTFFTLYFFVGILLWTLLEYSLHRWVFHMKIDSKSGPWLCTFHFLIHGLHHKVPFDPLRLVFPPLPGAVLAYLLSTPFRLFCPYPGVLLGGALFGYLCYDLMHYYLHYGNPNMEHMYKMKRYHYQHHFGHQDIGYGISSPLWDILFKTQIHLRKLKYRLRW